MPAANEIPQQSTTARKHLEIVLHTSEKQYDKGETLNRRVKTKLGNFEKSRTNIK